MTNSTQSHPTASLEAKADIKFELDEETTHAERLSQLRIIMVKHNSPGFHNIVDVMSSFDDVIHDLYCNLYHFKPETHCDFYIPDSHTLNYVDYKAQEMIAMLNMTIETIQERIDSFILSTEKARLLSDPTYTKLVSEAHRRTTLKEAKSARSARKMRKIMNALIKSSESISNSGESNLVNRKIA